MKKQLLSCCLAALGLTAIQAQSFNEWKDPEVNSVNRSAMHTNYFAYASADEAKAGIKENSTNFMTLNRSVEIQLGKTCRCTTDRFLSN